MTWRPDLFEDIWEDIREGDSMSGALSKREAVPDSVLQDLGTASALLQAGRDMEIGDLDRIWRSVASRIERTEESGSLRVATTRSPWRARTAALVVAAGMVLTGTALLAGPGGKGRVAPGTASTGVGAPAEASTETIARAETTISGLVRAARQGARERVLTLARELARLRRDARFVGTDTSSLDALIRRTMSGMLPFLPADLVQGLRRILGDLVPEQSAAPGAASPVGETPGPAGSPHSQTETAPPVPTPSFPPLPTPELPTPKP